MWNDSWRVGMQAECDCEGSVRLGREAGPGRSEHRAGGDNRIENAEGKDGKGEDGVLGGGEELGWTWVMSEKAEWWVGWSV